MDQYTQLLYGLAGVAIVGFVAWVVKSIFTMQAQVLDLKLYVTQNYAPNSDLSDIKSDIRGIRDLLHEVAGKLSIPIIR